MSSAADFAAFESDLDSQVEREPSENVAEDMVEYLRGNVIANEEQGLLGFFQLGTGWLYDMARYVNLRYEGPPGGGKSMLQGKIVRVLPSKFKYETTQATDNALIDDPKWDRALVAPLDEYDKLSGQIREYLKSMAGEDGGITKQRNVEDDSAKGGYTPVEVSSDAMPFQLLFAPRNKGGIDDELDDRMLVCHVDDSKEIREAIGRKEAGHSSIDVPGLEPTYIYETDELKRMLRGHFRDLDVREVYEEEEDEDGNLIEQLDSRRGAQWTTMPNWVWYAVKPIFDDTHTYVNRVYGMVFNMIRSSAVLNHHNRETVVEEVEVDDKDEPIQTEVIVVEPQDVANILSCQRSLLSTTHQLGPVKRNILDAVQHTQGQAKDGMTTTGKVKEWLDENDRTHPSRQTLTNRMDTLHDGYFLRKVEGGGGQNGKAHLWSLNDDGTIQPPRLTNIDTYVGDDNVELGEYGHDIEDPFKDCTDPIRNQPFKETVRNFESEFSSDDSAVAANKTMSAADAMGGDDVEEDADDDSQASLGDVGGSESEEADVSNEPSDENITLDASATPDDPTEEFVLDILRNLDEDADNGHVVADDHDVGQVLNIIDDRLHESDYEGTPLDPSHDLWQGRPDLADDRVRAPEDCKRELSDAYAGLNHKGLLAEDHSAAPPMFKVVRLAK